jgi:hypothetical protein
MRSFYCPALAASGWATLDAHFLPDIRFYNPSGLLPDQMSKTRETSQQRRHMFKKQSESASTKLVVLRVVIVI